MTDPEPIDPRAVDFIKKLAEAYGKLTPEQQRHLLAHIDTFLNFIATSSLGEIQGATESLSQSSGKLVNLTDSLGQSTRRMIWLTAALVLESAVIAGLTVTLLFHG